MLSIFCLSELLNGYDEPEILLRQMSKSFRKGLKIYSRSSICCRLMARLDAIEAVSTPMVTKPIIIDDSALISGLTPNRTEE